MAQAQQPAAAGATALVLDGVTVVDVAQGGLLPAQRVVIVGNRIQAVGDPRTVKLPTGARLVDASGKYLIPGLWDLHVHPDRKTEVFYPLLVAYGVTGVRIPNSEIPLDTLRLWRQEIVAGTRVGPPRQLLVGPSLDEVGGPLCGPGTPSHLCVALADVPRVVDSLKAAGANMLKMHFLSSEIYFALAAEARRQGLPFGGHLDPHVGGGQVISIAPGGEAPSALDASDSGASIIDHVNASAELGPLCLGTWGDPASVETCQPLAERFRRNGTWFVPTFMVSQAQGLLRWGASAQAAFADQIKRAGAFWSEAAWTASAPGDPASGAGAAATEPASSSGTGVLSIAARAGLPLLAGTDVSSPVLTTILPGLSLHTELAAYVAEGLTPLEALQTATLNPAKLLHGTDSLGTVAAGKLADLVLLDADPLADITNTTRIRAVVANGRYFDRAALNGLMTEARTQGGQGEPPSRVEPEP